MSQKSQEMMKKFTAEVVTFGGVEWVPVWARNVDEANEAASLEYGEENVGRVKPEVTQLALKS